MTRGVFRRLNSQWVPLRQQGRNLPRLQVRRLASEIVAAPEPPSDPAFMLGETKPSSANTGARTLSGLPVTNGSITVTTPGTVIEGREIRGSINVRAANVTIRNNWVRGADGSGTLINCDNAAASNVLIERNTIIPQPGLRVGIAISGHDYKSLRNDISGSIDGHRPRNINAGSTDADIRVSIHGDYVHHLGFYVPDSGQSDNLTHSDCIQIEGGQNVDIFGCTLYSFGHDDYGQINVQGYFDSSNKAQVGNPYLPQKNTLSCVIITPNVGICNGFRIRKNWMSGGQSKINISEKGRGAITGGQIAGNRYDRDGLVQRPALPTGTDWSSRPHAIASATRAATEITDNYWTDNNALVTN